MTSQEDSLHEENKHPKVTFTSKEMFEEAHKLCQQIPHWKGEHENPIHYFVPVNERPFPDPATEENI